MNFFHVKSTISVALIFLVMGTMLGIYLTSACNKPSRPLTQQTVVNKASDSIKNYYAPLLVKLRQQNKKLQLKLDVVNQKLPAAKAIVQKREQKIKRLTGPMGYPAKQLLQKVKAVDQIEETIICVTICDSLAQEVTQYIEETHYKDSLLEEKIAVQDSLLVLKDEVIETQAKYLISQDGLLKQSMAAQNILQQENSRLHKKIRKRKLGSKLAAIGVAIGSVFVTQYVNQH